MIADNAQLNIEDVFALISERNSDYRLRSQQLEMAHAVQTAFKRKQTGIFEAGTGTGKSLAALVPAVLSGKRVVVSTATIALQEQYINKDIPLLQEALPFKLKSAIMKGRGNYLSIRRYRDSLAEQEIDERVVDWTDSTAYGDMSELNFVPAAQLWMEINSDKDDCLQKKCPNFADCFYFKARQEADSADIVVVNHALLLADAVSQGNILPEYGLLIVDEAQHVADIARDTFSIALSSRGLKYLLTKAGKQLHVPMRLSEAVELAADELFYRLNELHPEQKARIRQPVTGAGRLEQALLNLKLWLQSQEFESVLDIELMREKMKLKARTITVTVNSYLSCLDLLQHPSEDWVLWTDRGNRGNFEIIAAPLVVAPVIQEVLFDRPGLESSVWMSATLATGGQDAFAYFKEQTGIEELVVQEKFSSPFDYRRQAVLYLPAHLPQPDAPDYTVKVAEEIENILHLSNGRAFVLFTSYKAMNASFELLQERLPFACRRQGDMPRRQLIDWFRSVQSAVLFGTSSFWEGISIDGDQLSCVIIDRIPFQVPDDPVYEAQCEIMQQQAGRSWFNELSLPHAIMRLKQGVGRLIRTENDTGIVAVLDSRLTGKGYGRQIIECLPPMRIINSLPDQATLEELLEAAR